MIIRKKVIKKKRICIQQNVQNLILLLAHNLKRTIKQTRRCSLEIWEFPCARAGKGQRKIRQNQNILFVIFLTILHCCVTLLCRLCQTYFPLSRTDPLKGTTWETPKWNNLIILIIVAVQVKEIIIKSAVISSWIPPTTRRTNLEFSYIC